MNSTDRPDLPWRKSSYGNGQANCVEVAAAAHRYGLVAVRDSKSRDGAGGQRPLLGGPLVLAAALGGFGLGGGSDGGQPGFPASGQRRARPALRWPGRAGWPGPGRLPVRHESGRNGPAPGRGGGRGRGRRAWGHGEHVRHSGGGTAGHGYVGVRAVLGAGDHGQARVHGAALRDVVGDRLAQLGVAVTGVQELLVRPAPLPGGRVGGSMPDLGRTRPRYLIRWRARRAFSPREAWKIEIDLPAGWTVRSSGR